MSRPTLSNDDEFRFVRPLATDSAMPQCKESQTASSAELSAIPPTATSWQSELLHRQFFQKRRRFPWPAVLWLLFIIIGCLAAPLIANHDPAHFYLHHLSEAPNQTFYFGTDALGRDIYSSIWYGGRLSLGIGVLSMLVSTGLGVLYGALSGLASRIVDTVLMRTAEILSSIPSLLLMILCLAFISSPSPISIALIIGGTTWMNLARIVRSEVCHIKNSDYVWAARFMGAGPLYILRCHLWPSIWSPIMFMVVSSIGSAILMESTLSFLGLGLSVDVISWGTMLSLANRALLTNAWWVILIPGIFLVITLLSITRLGYYIRRQLNRGCSNL